MYNMKNDMKQNKKEKYWDIYSVIGLLTFGWVLWLLVGLFPKKETKYPRIYNNNVVYVVWVLSFKDGLLQLKGGVIGILICPLRGNR